MPGRRYNLPHLAFLQGFEAAARTLSFTKAAEELFVTQSAVSRQIKALEDNLGLKLFERRSRSLALTDNGQALYRIATDVFDRLQAATDRLRAETRALALLAVEVGPAVRVAAAVLGADPHRRPSANLQREPTFQRQQ
jgi:DNA-binding transcriptional LysR family regulator